MFCVLRGNCADTIYAIASGLLGRDVIQAFEAAQWRTVGTGLTRASPPAILKLDLLNKENVKAVLDEAR